MKSTAYNDIANAIYEFLLDKTGEDMKTAQKKVVRFLAYRRLLGETRNILAKVEKIANEKEGRLSARISSANALGSDSKQLIREMLKKKYFVREVEMDEKEDKRLLGGLRIEINDEIIDNTIRGKINKLQAHLIK